MLINSCRNFIIPITLMGCVVFSSIDFLFAQGIENLPFDNKGYVQTGKAPEKKKGTVLLKEGDILGSQDEKKLTALQKHARIYRDQGCALQSIGNLDEAMVLYQKAAEFDPSYAIVHNDLGIVYETKGMLERAEKSYLRATQTDPRFLSPYSNLALLYENKRDLDKAKIYWEKRAQMGLGDDPWTQRARKRLEDIRLVLSDRPLEDIREREVAGFIKDVENQKRHFKKDDKKEKVNRLFEKAKMSYKAGEYATAIKEALDAQLLDPSNKQIETFIEEAQLRALLK
ncbi:MAG: tetratricopeptide repeat protein [Candidatus Omnitrophota bacterium]